MKTMRGSLWTWVKARMSSWAAGRPVNGLSLSVAARLDLGAKKSLLVVEYGQRRFLVGSGAETVSAILEIGPGRSAESHGRAASRRRPRRARARDLQGQSAAAHGEHRVEISRGKR